MIRNIQLFQNLVAVQVLNDPEHPAVQPASVLPLVLPFNGPATGFLNEIVCNGRIARQARRETAEAGEQKNELFAKIHRV